jgi:hypothetical protein
MLKYELSQEQFDKIYDQLRGHFRDLIPRDEINSFRETLVPTLEYQEREKIYFRWHQALIQDILNEAFWEGFELARGGDSQLRAAQIEKTRKGILDYFTDKENQ